jgi:hypothetical protein
MHILWHSYFNPCLKKYGQVEDATKFEMKLSAISPLTSIAYSIRDPSLLAGIVSYQPLYQHCLQHQEPQPLAGIVSYQLTYQHCLQHQEPKPVGRFS